MELRTINSFIKVASLQNFSKAAERMGYSQSTVTIQIKQLEEELGVQLFDRIGRKVFLTEKGKLFLEYAIEITRTVHDAVTNVKRKEEITGTLRIGSVESISTSIFSDLLVVFHQKFLKVNTLIKASASNHELLSMLKNNELDLICTLSPKVYGAEWVRKFQTEEQIVFVSSKRPSKSLTPLKELVSAPFLLTEKNESYRYQLDHVLAEKNLEINPVLESGNTETILKLIKAGIGISFLPLYAVEKDIADKNIFIIHTDAAPINMWCQLIYHKNKLLTPQMMEFINMFETWYDNRRKTAPPETQR